MTVRPDSPEAGLSMIEVLVAVAVLGMALAPLVVVQGQIARTHQRYEESYARTTLQRNALAILQDMNPMQTPSGEIALDDENMLVWTSRPLTDVSRGSDHPVGDSANRTHGVTFMCLAELPYAAFATSIRVELSPRNICWRAASMDRSRPLYP